MFEQVLEQPTATGNKPLIHLYCRICYPELKPGIITFCGTKALGKIQPPGTADCVVCLELKDNPCNKHA